MIFINAVLLLLPYFWNYLVITECDIIRLPCKRHGNFSIKKEGVKYSGTTIKEVTGVDEAGCAVHCVANDICNFVNYKADETLCQLLEKNSGTETNEIGWRFLSTQRSVARKGPFCKITQPCADLTEYCEDDCTPQGYTCVERFKTISSFLSVSSTPALSSNPVTNAYDNDDASWFASVPSSSPFVKFDLGESKVIRFIRLMTNSKMIDSVVTVGDTNTEEQDAFCGLTNDKHYTEAYIMVCDGENDLSGRYVGIYRHVANTQYFIHDISIYVDA